MGDRKRKNERGLREILEGLQQLLAWQAELVREGLKQLGQDRPSEKVKRSGGKADGRPS